LLQSIAPGGRNGEGANVSRHPQTRRVATGLAAAAVVFVALGASTSLADPRDSASAGVVGTYTTTISKPSELVGRWTLDLAGQNKYAVVLNGEPVARGTYIATATRISFVHETGSPCKGSGTYGWKRSGKTMTFTRVREAASCRARAIVLAHPFVQVK
jgi:hypothetical protein